MYFLILFNFYMKHFSLRVYNNTKKINLLVFSLSWEESLVAIIALTDLEKSRKKIQNNSRIDENRGRRIL